MRGKSEFQEILEKLLNQDLRQTPFRESIVFDPPRYDFKINFSRKFGKYEVPKPRPQKKRAEPPPKVAPPRQEPPRIKRQLTFDQVKAVEVFASFGESEINEYATIQEIKWAYRRLAKKHHPDLGGSGESFKKISLAYRRLLA